MSLLIISLLVYVGCAGAKTKQTSVNPANDLPLVDPLVINAASPGKPLAEDSSLWKDSSGYLFTDPRARNVGDVVTVNITERASASGNASTKAGKKSSLSAKVSSLFGFEKSLADRNSNLDPENLLSTSTDSSFDGSGEISRSGKITATITARVIETLANGNLIIRGTRQVTINNEQQVLIIQGIIRPEDISPANTIASTSIAEAQISYTGKGVVSDKQQPGWLGRMVDRVWPF